jgi:hypothetical protein
MGRAFGMRRAASVLTADAIGYGLTMQSGAQILADPGTNAAPGYAYRGEASKGFSGVSAGLINLVSSGTVHVQYGFGVVTVIATTGSQSFALTGDISPAALAATANDWNPTGNTGSAVIRVDTTAARNITGLVGGSDGRIVLMLNVSAFVVSLLAENVGSTAANRFAISATGVLAKDIPAGGCALLVYDATSSRWRVL